MVNKYVLLFICLSVVILLTGCWDEVNIEDRGFIVGSAIDLAESHDPDDPKVTVTNQFVLPSKLGGPSEMGGEGKAFSNLSVSGGSIFAIVREMATLTSKMPYFEHLKVIVVSEEVAREPNLFSSLMDFYNRDHEMRREIRVLISEGKASEILEMDPANEDIPALHINDVIENKDQNLETLEPVRIGDIHEFLLDESSYIIPRVFPSHGRVHYRGAGVFYGHDDSLAGILDQVEAAGLNLIKGEKNGGTITFEIDERLMTFEIEEMKSNTEIDTKDPENIAIDITVEAEGIISEMFGDRSLLQADYMSEIEAHVEHKMEQLINAVLEKGQHELGIDFFDFHLMLKQNHYKTWKQIEDNWEGEDNIFAQSNINVSTDVTIRSTGAGDRTKDRGNE
ncbi:Ger(x)C family spore germination protein [Virgibacillus sp. CBA3643]|uniref:Ger(x)C family spore germination protein n=1 Tax=Virgibacillus sp. CBA3643 TaxID=2942278 RepID=UPI0035A29006